MTKIRNKTESQYFKSQILAELDDYLSQLIDNGQQSKSDKISYWIKDWIGYLERENSFNPRNMIGYKRGNIVKVNLGFNVGSEEGGLHYAIVLDAKNELGNPVFTVIPLTSVKPHTDTTKLRHDQVFLGHEVYNKLTEKLTKLLDKLSAVQLSEISSDELTKFEEELNYAKRIKSEIYKMRTGSIALVGQITTISKLRIYDPKNKYGVLKGVRVSNDILDKIDECLIQKYFNKIK